MGCDDRPAEHGGVTLTGRPLRHRWCAHWHRDAHPWLTGGLV